MQLIITAAKRVILLSGQVKIIDYSHKVYYNQFVADKQ